LVIGAQVKAQQEKMSRGQGMSDDDEEEEIF
jgi:hypothetical protein